MAWVWGQALWTFFFFFFFSLNHSSLKFLTSYSVQLHHIFSYNTSFYSVQQTLQSSICCSTLQQLVLLEHLYLLLSARVLLCNLCCPVVFSHSSSSRCLFFFPSRSRKCSEKMRDASMGAIWVLQKIKTLLSIMKANRMDLTTLCPSARFDQIIM